MNKYKKIKAEFSALKIVRNLAFYFTNIQIILLHSLDNL